MKSNFTENRAFDKGSAVRLENIGEIEFKDNNFDDNSVEYLKNIESVGGSLYAKNFGIFRIKNTKF